MTDLEVKEILDEETLLNTLLTSYWYNRSEKHMVSIALELKGRIEGTFPCYLWSDDVDIIYGTLVLRFGDYGTSPRSGWIKDESKKILNSEIDKYIVEFKREYELEKEEEDEV